MILRVAVPALLLAAALAGCGGDDDAATDSPSAAASSPAVSRTATPTAAASVTAAPSEPAGLTFDVYAQVLADAISNASTDPFLDNPVITESECPNELTDCGVPAPTVIQGVVIGRWRSEGLPVPLDEFETQLANYLATGPTLQAIAQKNAEGEDGTPAYYAITAVEGDATTTAYFIFKEDSGAFRLQAMVLAPVLGEEWLSGDCAECYDQWQEW